MVGRGIIPTDSEARLVSVDSLLFLQASRSTDNVHVWTRVGCISASPEILSDIGEIQCTFTPKIRWASILLGRQKGKKSPTCAI
jgi:hypothetical protein